MSRGSVLWSEPDVYVHPTAYARDNVAGALSLQGPPPARLCYTTRARGAREEPESSYVLVDAAEAGGRPKPVPPAFDRLAADLASIRVYPPSLVQERGSVELAWRDGGGARLYFHGGGGPRGWGGARLLSALEPYVDLLHSQLDPQLYLANADRAERERHATPAYADDALDRADAGRVSGDSLGTWARSARFSVLSHLSRVTLGARESGRALLEHPLLRRAAPSAAASYAQAGPHMLAPRPGAPPEQEYDAARVYLARWATHVSRAGALNRAAVGTDGAADAVEDEALPHATAHAPLDLDAWRALLDDGLPADAVAQLVFHRGIAPEARADAWPYLMRAMPLLPQRARREAAWSERMEGYDAAVRRWFGNASLLAEGEHAAAARRIWLDCLRADVRHVTLPQLDEQAQATAVRRMDASAWVRRAADEREEVNAHLYALSEVLLTYMFYEHDEARRRGVSAPIGTYVQGMSDLCVVVYAACDGDVPRTFWCLVGAMERLHPNFAEDQRGMRTALLTLQALLAELCPALYRHLDTLDGLNLFFCFRWLLVCFRREFALPAVHRLWESIFASDWTEAPGTGSAHGWPLCRHFELFVALAILESHERVVVRYLHSFDEVLEYTHALAGQLDAGATLRRAEALVYRLRAHARRAETPLPDVLRSLLFEDHGA